MKPAIKLIAEKYGPYELNGKCREWDQTGPMHCGGPDYHLSALTYISVSPGIILVPAGGRLEIYAT